MNSGNVVKRAARPSIFCPAGNRKIVILVLGLVVASAVIYLPVLQNDFVNFDDVFYIIHNPLITNVTGENIKNIFSQFYFGNYHPLTMLSLALDHELAGLNPRMYHATNVLLHCLNTVLVFWFMCLLINRNKHAHEDDGWNLTIPLITAVFFGLHPLHVESVAWASQRKDLLYSLFYLACLIAYLHYVCGGSRKFYMLSLLFFLLSALSKAMAVSLFGIIIALDYYLDRLPFLNPDVASGRGEGPTAENDPSDSDATLFPRRPMQKYIILEKIPYLLLSLVFGIVAIQAQKSASFVAHTSLFPMMQRILFACYGFCQYLIKLIFPVRLSAYYPYPETDGGGVPFEYMLWPVMVIGVFIWLLTSLKRNRVVAFGLLFFILNILPVLQLLPIGNFIMAERFTYLPSLGVFVLIGVGFRTLAVKAPKLVNVLRILFVAYLILLALITFNRSKIWRDSITLWDDVLAKNPQVWLALNNRGIAKSETGDFQGAIADYTRALLLKPDYADAYCNRGNLKGQHQDYNGAIADFNAAIQHQPGHGNALANLAEAHFYRGVARFQAADYQGALADFTRVVSLNPHYPGAQRNLQLTKRRLGLSPNGGNR